jgi:hypothetical protein
MKYFGYKSYGDIQRVKINGKLILKWILEQ